jgi:hypothetical protein
VFLILIIIAMCDREVGLFEVLEISQFNLPENVFAVEIKLKELETGKESQEAFLVKSEENKIIKKGGKYVFISGTSNENLRNIGIKRELLKVYELK